MPLFYIFYVIVSWVLFLFQTILFTRIKFLNKSTWSINGTLTGTTTPSESGPESNGNEGVLHTPQFIRVGTSASYQDTFLFLRRGVWLSAGGTQLVYSQLHQKSQEMIQSSVYPHRKINKSKKFENFVKIKKQTYIFV